MVCKSQLLAWIWVLVLVKTIYPVQSAEYVGNQACEGCHKKASTEWTNSHHDLAMQKVTPDTVLGDFDNVEFEYHGITTTFAREGDEFFVTTDNSKGDLETFPVQYVFGVYPLQQYLLPTSGGRLQALSIAWDSRPNYEGGQRWYHLYESENVRAGHPLHWTGVYHNWNASCAECHSTSLKKGFDSKSGVYKTTYEQIDVGCEACHGPGSVHVQLALNKAISPDQSGLDVKLDGRGTWLWENKESIAKRQVKLRTNAQIDTCGRCHSRRGTLGEYHHGQSLLDTHQLSLIEEPLYWPDGQIREEVYVYGSFVQSKMHQAGVVCTNCHNPHSNQLLAEGNLLCAQCHQPTQFDRYEHHHHEPDSAGSFCVNCHMPHQTYMGVDARRDHSMRVPRPDLSIATGSPNACNQCHLKQSPNWAVIALKEWGVQFEDLRQHQAVAFRKASQGDIRAAPRLVKTANDQRATALLRASAIKLIGNLAPELGANNLSFWLKSNDPMIRMSAVQSIDRFNSEFKYLLLRPLISDPSKSVRMAVADQLAGTALETISKIEQSNLTNLFDEYLSTQSLHLDIPATLAQLGNFWLDRGAFDKSEQILKKTIELNPLFSSARVNLADLYRQIGDEVSARKTLESGLIRNPNDSALWFSLALLKIREGGAGNGLEALKRAATLESTPGYYNYVYAVALQDAGRNREALEALSAIHVKSPGQPNILSALSEYSDQTGDPKQAIKYKEELNETLRAAGIRR